MINLLEETRNHLAVIGKRPSDIIFIGSVETCHGCTWNKFVKLANQEYDNGYGAAEVANDLVIIYEDGTHSERIEYDGAESWEYRPMIKKPVVTLPITTLFGYDSLARINGDDTK